MAHNWGIKYIETSAKTRDNVDLAFSDIFIKIKQLKALRQKTSGANKLNRKNTLSKEQEEAIRADSIRKRIQKYFKNTKKRCTLS